MAPDKPAESPADSARVIAEDRLGPITVDDLDRYILELPPAARQIEGEAAEWYATATRRLAVERLLAEDAELLGVEQDSSYQASVRLLERRLSSEYFLSQWPTPEPVTEEELRSDYESRKAEEYERPERRQVYHLFKRYGGGKSREEVDAELQQLRLRVLAGEPFTSLAKEHSESESRHREGLLGPVERGHFPPDFDRVVFALEQRVPSEPISTRDGGHIFFVDAVMEEKSFAFEEVRSEILRGFSEQRERETLTAAAASLPAAEDLLISDPEQIATLMRSGDLEAILLRVGDFQLTVRRFHELLLEARRQAGARPRADLAIHLYDEIHHREIIYQNVGVADLPARWLTRLGAEKRRKLVEVMAQRKSIAGLESDQVRVQEHYAGNEMRFATPVRARLTRASIPIGKDPSALMSKLEGARAELDSGELVLEGFAEGLGGVLLETGVLSPAQLQMLDPAALRFVFTLGAGRHSPPYRQGQNLIMFRVDERFDAKPQPLALVWDQVIADYLSHDGSRLFKELSDQWLEEAGFRMVPEVLATFGSSVGAYSTSE